MAKTGILIHCRHPLTKKWEQIVWGIPNKDQLGDLPKLVEFILQEPKDEPIEEILIGSTAATKDGLLEGEYTKKYLLDHFAQLWDFPRLKKQLEALSKPQIASLRERLQRIEITPIIVNTTDELVTAARLFNQKGVDKVLQITSASHGPRCIQAQALVRSQGGIPAGQLWTVAVSDMCFEDTTPLSTVILETPHRGDDPMIDVKPTLPETIRPYLYELTPEDKRKFITVVAEFMDEHKTASK